MSEEKKMLQFDLERKQLLRKAYEQALKDKQEKFVFQGHEILTLYAKYMLEYLDGQMPDPE